jgi:CheY-like chemotaxis protein
MNEEKKQIIMIVEDDSFVMDIYKTKLLQAKFEVVEAMNGVEAMKKIKKIRPDLVLLDIMMPYMDGLEVLKNMKNDPNLKNIPTILLTNLSQKEDVDKGMALGADDYLIKSHFTPSEVLEKIKTCLAGKIANE